MRSLLKRSYLLSCLFLCFALMQVVWAMPASTPDSQTCSLPEPHLGANRPNLFNDQQEQWLGDIMAAQEEASYYLVPEPETEELTRIGQKLLGQPPPTPIHYRFRVYDSEDLNAFSIAGGYIYVSRKIIIDARSEDEIAGILAHEIGHIYTHQIATTISRSFDKMLHVNSVGDHDDILDKYQRMLNAPWKWRSDLAPDEAEKDELRADAVGLYALVRAGYAPQALPNNLERTASNAGRNGNFLSDILGGTSEVGMRVRTARRIANATSDACKQRQQTSSPEFVNFQQALLSSPVNALIPATPGLQSVELANPIRPGLNTLRFSPDGKYLVAQNETYVYVLSRSPLKEIFHVYAPGASAAHFTPDSAHLVFHYQSLRVEDWDVVSGRLLGAHELIEYQGCSQSELSPDGKLLACVYRNRADLHLSLELFDVDSGKVVWSKMDSFLPDSRAQSYGLMTRPDWDPAWLALAFSPDSHYMVVASVANNLALDLRELKPVKMRGDLGQIVQGRLTFVAPDEILYDCEAGQREIFQKAESNVCLVEFPSGVTRAKFVEGWESLTPVAKGNYVVAGSLFDSIPHLVDLTAGKAASPLKFLASDVFDTQLASESGKGGVTVGEFNAAKVDAAELPAIPLPYVSVARFSDDGRYLALSNENRGAIWDLASNRQIALTRSFRGAWFDASGKLYLQLPVGQAKPGQNLCVDLKTGGVTETGKFDRNVRQYLDVRIDADWLDPEKALSHDNNELQVFDGKAGNLLWKRRFPKDHPSIWQQEPGVLIFFFSMGEETAWDEIAHSSLLTKTTDMNREEHQGVLTELVDSHTGAVLRQVISPEGALGVWGENLGGSVNGKDNRFARVYGNLVAVHGNQGNTVVYDARTGERQMATWGRAIAGNEGLGLIAVTNRDQEVIVYDVHSGKERSHVIVDHPVCGARFVPGKGQLLVVTRNQRLYTLDISGSGKGGNSAVETAAGSSK